MFLLFLVFLGFLLFLVLFLISTNIVFGFFLVIHYFCLVLRFLFNCFWSLDLGTSGLMTSHLTLRPPEFSVLTKLKS